MKETGLKPFPVRKYGEYLAKIPLARIDRLMESCAEIDVLSKSSRIDGDLLVVRLLNEALELL
ncbi:MAG: hypothetical protein IJC19_02640 [Clostridia bacterium]|nr:hypothetical protein [Clostridia bacterium]